MKILRKPKTPKAIRKQVSQAETTIARGVLYRSGYRSGWTGVIIHITGNIAYVVPLFDACGRLQPRRHVKTLHISWLTKTGQSVNLPDFNPDWFQWKV